MRLFLAAIYTNRLHFGGSYFEQMNEREKTARHSVKNILESYHYIHKQSYVDTIRQDGQKVFLDSGAFSAFTQGVEINLDNYCRYIHENKDIVEVASVLDGIGDPLKTYQNQHAMEQNGTTPLPCFHYGEDERYLVHYIDNYEYITLGGMVPISNKQLYYWLDNIWEKYLCKPDGTARIRVHGFGMTSLDLMKRYPWYSVDSSSWVQIGSMGNILTHDLGTLSLSTTSPSLKERNRHLETLPAGQKSAFVGQLQAEGWDYQRLREKYVSRWAYCMGTFTEMNERINRSHGSFKPEQPTLF